MNQPPLACNLKGVHGKEELAWYDADPDRRERSLGHQGASENQQSNAKKTAVLLIP